MKYFEKLQSTSLVWLPEHGIGRFPVELSALPYNKDYFDKYKELANTQVGRNLNSARVDFVKRHWKGPVLDVGIGSGTFIEAHGDALGYDINPAGVEWLKERGLWADLYTDSHSVVCMWDSLEHMEEPEKAVAKVDKWVFVSLPIFENADHILCSKHFRRDEHIFYWTHEGFINWFGEQGFFLVEHNLIESDLGREGIGSYAFKRVEL